MSFIGEVEEFRCSYESRLPLRIEFATFPDWNWLVANLQSARFSTDFDQEAVEEEDRSAERPQDYSFFKEYTWDSVLIARVPILPKM